MLVKHSHFLACLRIPFAGIVGVVHLSRRIKQYHILPTMISRACYIYMIFSFREKTRRLRCFEIRFWVHFFSLIPCCAKILLSYRFGREVCLRVLVGVVFVKVMVLRCSITILFPAALMLIVGHGRCCPDLDF